MNSDRADLAADGKPARKRRYAALLLAIFLAGSLLVGGDRSGASAPAGEEVTVFAAASLKSALDPVADAWEAKTGGMAVISYAGTSALARQIEAGAPADIFLSADREWMDYVGDKGLVRRASIVELLGNRIVLIAPQASSVRLDIRPGFDLVSALGDGRLAVANVDAVPAGRYARAALQALGVWDAIGGRIAQADNVRAALALVALGEAPLGIVYATDAQAEPAVRVVGEFPEDTHPPIVYPVALTAAAGKSAEDFLAFLQGEEAEDLFVAQGFSFLPQKAGQ